MMEQPRGVKLTDISETRLHDSKVISRYFIVFESKFISPLSTANTGFSWMAVSR